jgi:hypothetical protein
MKTITKIALNLKFRSHKSERSKYNIPVKNQICLVMITPFSEIDDCPEKILVILKPACWSSIKNATAKSPEIEA